MARLPKQIGRYQVVRLLGRGAMGQVLLARDPVLDRKVAVKLLRGDLALAADQKQQLIVRMRHEARASARLSHPSIVALHDMGEDGQLGLFLVFEYLAGTTLEQRLKRGALGADATARLAREVGDALSTAHSAGVLHRDIKPGNLILTDACAKIADFGIARVPDSTLTQSGGLLGTPAYSAPEAIANGTFSPRSDQFSMAATLWEALTGRRAFPGEDAVAVATRITTEHPPAIAKLCGLDPHVDDIFARGLAKRPEARYPSCAQFGRALAEALESISRSRMQTLPDDRHRRAQQSSRGTRAWQAAVGGAAVGVFVTLALYELRDRLQDARAPELPKQVAELPLGPSAEYLAETHRRARRVDRHPPRADRVPTVAASEPSATVNRAPVPRSGVRPLDGPSGHARAASSSRPHEPKRR
jgi:serine/threonine protein kinase